MIRLVAVNLGAPPAGAAASAAAAPGRAPTARVHTEALGADTPAGPANAAHRAIRMYPAEHYAFWNTVRRQTLRAPGTGRTDGLMAYAELPDLPWGTVGEHLTVAGLAEQQVYVGDVLAIGSAEFVVTRPRLPQPELNTMLGFRHAAKLMQQSGYCGWYLEVRRAGELAAGDAVALRPGDREHALTIAQAFRLEVSR